MKPRGKLHQSMQRAAQVSREAAPHTTLNHNEQLQDVSSPWTEETPCQETEPSWVPIPLQFSGSVGSCEAGPRQESRAMVTQPWRPLSSPGGPAELRIRHLFVGHQEKQDKVGQQLTRSP